MKRLEKFNFKFKGSRDYVHGTDIYKAFHDYCIRDIGSDFQNVQISFHDVMRNNLELVVECEDEDIKALISVTSGSGAKQKFYLKESVDQPTERYAYDEDAVVEGWGQEVDGLSAILKNPSSEYTTIESLVALNKAFLTKLHQPDGKWLFARLKIKGFLPDMCKSIRLSTNASSNLRLVRSKIEIDGQSFGEIYFSLI